jgi:hypothetical protein
MKKGVVVYGGNCCCCCCFDRHFSSSFPLAHLRCCCRRCCCCFRWDKCCQRLHSSCRSQQTTPRFSPLRTGHCCCCCWLGAFEGGKVAAKVWQIGEGLGWGSSGSKKKKKSSCCQHPQHLLTVMLFCEGCAEEKGAFQSLGKLLRHALTPPEKERWGVTRRRRRKMQVKRAGGD